MEFKSQISTTREQSDRLLSLGLKKETADMTIHIKDDDGWYVTAEPFCEWEDDRNTFPSLVEPEPIVPAWSLHRLIEIAGDDTGTIAIRYEGVTFNKDIYFYSHPTTYDNLIDCIEWLIKEDALKKQYLEKKL